ncbi:MAG: glycosyltransferase family 39 protein [Kouleothrix sp.]|nr:glycosyltransferase family 39 protein [Kouleothrix sp.]
MEQSLDISSQQARLDKGVALIQWIKSHKLALCLVFIGLLIRVYGLTLYPFNGDEYNTIAESKKLGLNWTSWLYYVFMHAWINLGVNDVVMRLPSLLIDVITVLILSSFAKQFAGQRAAVAIGLLAATSPFLIYHAQEARFYSLFIFTTALFMFLTVRLTGQLHRRSARAAILAGGIALSFSHFLGLLAVAAQGLAMFTVVDLPWSRRKRMSAVTFLFSSSFVILLLPPVQRLIWSFYQSVVYTTSGSDPVLVSISATSLAKIAVALYVFTFGYHVYPLWWIVVVPGIVLTGLLLLVGSTHIARHTRWGMLPILFGLALVGAYTALDSVGGRLASGISPRHVAFVWPVYILLIAIGLSRLPYRVSYAVLGVLVALNIASLYPRWAQEWSYTGLTDYRAAAVFASEHLRDKTLILHDGRAQWPISVYFSAAVPHKNYGSYLQGANLDELLGYDRIILVTDDYQPVRRRDADWLLARLSERFTVTAGRVDYPLFEYVLDRKPVGAGGFFVDPATGQVQQPVGIYGLELQDLRLPVQVETQGHTLNVVGGATVSSEEARREMSMPLIGDPAANRITLVSTLLGGDSLAQGQQIAELEVAGVDGSVRVFPLRYGIEVQDWSQTCSDQSACQTIYRWHKRVAFVGQQSYPGAWRDFEAGMHSSTIALPQRTRVSLLSIRYTAQSGRLYIWGLAAPR